MNRRATHPCPLLQIVAANNQRARAAQRVREFREQLEKHIITVDYHPVARAKVMRAGFLDAYLKDLEDAWIAGEMLNLSEYEKAINLFCKVTDVIPISRRRDKLSNDRLWKDLAERNPIE